MGILVGIGYVLVAIFFFGLLDGMTWNDDGVGVLVLFAVLWPVTIAALLLFGTIFSIGGLGHIVGEWISDKLDDL